MSRSVSIRIAREHWNQGTNLSLSIEMPGINSIPSQFLFYSLFVFFFWKKQDDLDK